MDKSGAATNVLIYIVIPTLPPRKAEPTGYKLQDT